MHAATRPVKVFIRPVAQISSPVQFRVVLWVWKATLLKSLLSCKDFCTSCATGWVDTPAGQPKGCAGRLPLAQDDEKVFAGRLVLAQDIYFIPDLYSGL